VSYVAAQTGIVNIWAVTVASPVLHLVEDINGNTSHHLLLLLMLRLLLIVPLPFATGSTSWSPPRSSRLASAQSLDKESGDEVSWRAHANYFFVLLFDQSLSSPVHVCV
jgi:hypothetical protein